MLKNKLSSASKLEIVLERVSLEMATGEDVDQKGCVEEGRDGGGEDDSK